MERWGLLPWLSAKWLCLALRASSQTWWDSTAAALEHASCISWITLPESLIKLIKISYGWIDKSASGLSINWINGPPTFKFASCDGCSSISISWYTIRYQRSKIYHISIDNYMLNQTATSVYFEFWSHYYSIHYCIALIFPWLPLQNISKNTAPDQNHTILINLFIDKQSIWTCHIFSNGWSMPFLNT